MHFGSPSNQEGSKHNPFYKKKIMGIALFCLSLIFNTALHALSSPVTAPHKSIELHKIVTKRQKTVVLIHGLMRTPLSMSQLRYYLERQGYQVLVYSYPSAKNSIHEHGLHLNEFIKTIIAQYPKNQLYFITHSLGGIIARDALYQLPKQDLKKVSGLIMLAPPNQGSALAKFSTKIFPMLSYFIKPLAELSSEKTSYVHNVPIHLVKIAIIAGRYDAKVPPAAARRVPRCAARRARRSRHARAWE